MSTPEIPSIVALDEKYQPFPSFNKWIGLKAASDRWASHLATINEMVGGDPELLKKAREVTKRAAAIDTGAIEGLYDVDDGFTISVSMQAGMWQAAFQAKGEVARQLIEAQLAGYDQVIDLATKGAPLAEAWIRELHRVICAGQKTYRVITEQGEQDHELPLGSYKTNPNHVVRKNGTTHSYAPVLQTEPEMRRLLTDLTSEAFQRSHPIIQASFAHYALVCIHPFADGNGRTARALASVFTYRGSSIPFMVLMEHKQEYLAAIRRADSGELQAFVDFTSARSIQAFQMIEESLRAARFTSPLSAADTVKRLHVTKGGYSHSQIEEAAKTLVLALQQKAAQLSGQLSESGKLSIGVGWIDTGVPVPPRTGLRNFAAKPTLLHLTFLSPPPAESRVNITFFPYLPVDAEPHDSVVIRTNFQEISFEMPLTEIIPSPTTVMNLRVQIFLDGLFGAAISLIAEKGHQALRKSGLR